MASPLQVFADQELAGSSLTRGQIEDVSPAGLVFVEMPAGEVVECDVLVAVDGAKLSLSRGDEVLVWTPPTGRGVILGRIGGRDAESRETATRVSPRAEHTRSDSVPPPSPPDTLVIEATESLTLRVGDGSITIRADGKILIKGKDLVSHAKNVNRIKGGAVAIN